MFSRKCPNCGCELHYCNKYKLAYAIKNNSKCNHCATNGKNNPMYGKHRSEETRQKQSRSVSGKNNSRYGIPVRANGVPPWNKGKTNCFSKDALEKIGSGWRGKHRPPFSKEWKRKIRLARLKDLEKEFGYVYPNYNEGSISILEAYGQKNGYNFQHAQNGGEVFIKELGYWVDGYDRDKNVVIEYYEKKHLQMKDRDEQRKQEIINFLGCKFIEVWYDGRIIISENQYVSSNK